MILFILLGSYPANTKTRKGERDARGTPPSSEQAQLEPSTESSISTPSPTLPKATPATRISWLPDKPPSSSMSEYEFGGPLTIPETQIVPETQPMPGPDPIGPIPEVPEPDPIPELPALGLDTIPELDKIPDLDPIPDLDTVPETQLPKLGTPNPATPNARPPPTIPHWQTLPVPPAVMRRYVTMIWKPTGHNFRVDFRDMTFKKFLSACTEIQLTVGPDVEDSEDDPDLVKIQGVHYRIDGSRECFMKTAEDYEEFTKRLAGSRDCARITIKPVNFIVSFLQENQKFVTNKLSNDRRTSGHQLQIRTQPAYTTFRVLSCKLVLNRSNKEMVHPYRLTTGRGKGFQML